MYLDLSLSLCLYNRTHSISTLLTKIHFFFQSGGKDILTGLKSRTNAGRPNWDKIFQKLQAERKGKITVFYCGNPVVASIIRGKCEQFGFDFRKEVF